MAVGMKQCPVRVPIVAVVPVQMVHFHHILGHEAESALRASAVLPLEQSHYLPGLLWVVIQAAAGHNSGSRARQGADLMVSSSRSELSRRNSGQLTLTFI